jgi:hypothetical protein
MFNIEAFKTEVTCPEILSSEGPEKVEEEMCVRQK